MNDGYVANERLGNPGTGTDRKQTPLINIKRKLHSLNITFYLHACVSCNLIFGALPGVLGNKRT